MLRIVVVSYNTRALLQACLESVARVTASDDVDAETWVVDSASTDGSADLVRDRFPWCHLVALDENVGYAAAANRALRHWLESENAPRQMLVLNADVELRPGSLLALLEAAGEPDVAVVGPALQYPDGRFQHSAFRFPGLAQVVLDLFPVPRLVDTRLNGRYPRALYAQDRPFEVDFPLGACMLVRTDAVRRVGPLSERYFMYCEEIDWCLRFNKSGYRALCAPRATVVHHAGASTSQLRESMYVALWRSRLRLFRTHAPWWRAALLRLVVSIGLAFRGMQDRVAVSRGSLSRLEAGSRGAAYRAILSRDPARPPTSVAPK